jgi:hypothetical protein
VQRDGLPRAPAIDLGVRDLLDDLGVAAHRVAVEHREHELARAQVLVVVGEQDRRGPHHGLEDVVGLARVQDRVVAGEDLLDRGRVGDVDEVAHRRGLDGEDVAEAAPARLQEGQRVAPEQVGLDGLRQPRARRQRGHR